MFITTGFFSFGKTDYSINEEQTNKIEVPILGSTFSELDPQCLWLKQHCSALAFICQEIETHHLLNKEQKKVLIHCVGHLDRGALK